MFDTKGLDELARRMAERMPKGAQQMQEDLRRSVRSTLEAGIDKLDLVTREEFEVQAAVLARTRAKLEALEARVAALETSAQGKTNNETKSAPKSAAGKTRSKSGKTASPADKEPPSA